MARYKPSNWKDRGMTSTEDAAQQKGVHGIILGLKRRISEERDTEFAKATLTRVEWLCAELNSAAARIEALSKVEGELARAITDIDSFRKAYEAEANAARSLRAQLDAMGRREGEPIAWESTTLGYIRFVTDSRYRKFSPKVRSWYKPYRCSNCAHAATLENRNE